MSFTALTRKQILNAPLKSGSTFFIEAIIASDFELAEILLKFGADIDGGVETALQISIKAGNDAVKFLIKNGCKMTEEDCATACKYDRDEELLLLLEAGCPPCLLKYALFNGKKFHSRGWEDHSACAAMLLAHGAKKIGFIYPDEINGDVLKLLIAHGVDISCLDLDKTPDWMDETNLKDLVKNGMTEEEKAECVAFIQRNGGIPCK